VEVDDKARSFRVSDRPRAAKGAKGGRGASPGPTSARRGKSRDRSTSPKKRDAEKKVESKGANAATKGASVDSEPTKESAGPPLTVSQLS